MNWNKKNPDAFASVPLDFLRTSVQSVFQVVKCAKSWGLKSRWTWASKWYTTYNNTAFHLEGTESEHYVFSFQSPCTVSYTFVPYKFSKSKTVIETTV
jgi:hypothetical protein